jgi:hypothetical protein
MEATRVSLQFDDHPPRWRSPASHLRVQYLRLLRASASHTTTPASSAFRNRTIDLRRDARVGCPFGFPRNPPPPSLHRSSRRGNIGRWRTGWNNGQNGNWDTTEAADESCAIGARFSDVTWPFLSIHAHVRSAPRDLGSVFSVIPWWWRFVPWNVDFYQEGRDRCRLLFVGTCSWKGSRDHPAKLLVFTLELSVTNTDPCFLTNFSG